MRSNNHFRFLYYVLSFLLLYSCQTEYDKHDRTSEKRYGKEIEDVRQWVMEHYPEQFSINSPKETEPEMLLKADWGKAFTGSDSKEKTVEIPVFPIGVGVERRITLPENRQKYEETGDSRYISNFSRLVVKSDLQTKERLCFIMTIIPSASYWEKTNFSPFSKVTYFGREDYDGLIYFYHINGDYSNGWKYKDGKIEGSIKRQQPGTNPPAKE